MKAEDIAASLSEAQRKWLPTFEADWFAGRAIGMSKKTLSALIEKGLVEEDRPKFFGMVKWRLSETGAAVRSHLMKERGE